MSGARRHPHGVTGSAVTRRPPIRNHIWPREHREALLLSRMSVTARHPAARASRSSHSSTPSTAWARIENPLTAERVLDDMPADLLASRRLAPPWCGRPPRRTRWPGLRAAPRRPRTGAGFPRTPRFPTGTSSSRSWLRPGSSPRRREGRRTAWNRPPRTDSMIIAQTKTPMIAATCDRMSDPTPHPTAASSAAATT